MSEVMNAVREFDIDFGKLVSLSIVLGVVVAWVLFTVL